MNKQGNFNEFFDVSAGGGTYAPRKRQAYSSKRLQQVVSEFRSEKAKVPKGQSPTPGVSEESTGSGADNDAVDAEEGPVKKRRKTKGRGKEQAEAGDSTRKRAAGRAKGRGRGTKTASASRKKTVSKSTPDSEGDGDEYVGDAGDVVGFVPQLRPRPKPKPAYKGKVGPGEGDDDGT
jgi:DNA excision repair protein ERCC-5